MFNSNCNTASVPLVANIDGGYNRNDGMWGDGGWWIILLFLAFGWGGNGFGFGGNRNNSYPCATQADVRAAVDQQTLISKLDQQTYGLADTFTALNNTLNSNFRGIDNAICTLGYQNQQGFNTLGFQNQQCCCETQRLIERGFADTNYNIATQTNAIQNAMCNNTRDIIDNQNSNTRSILDFLVNDKLATLQAENQELKLAASQAALVNEIRPCAKPAYITCSPYQSAYGFGLNNNCGCC